MKFARPLVGCQQMRWVAMTLAVVGLGAAAFVLGRQSAPASGPTVVERLRAVSRLQVLDVSVTRRVTLRPEPVEQPNLGGALRQWARYAVAPPAGTALVAAEAHFSIDLTRLPAASVVVEGGRVELTLPQPEVSIQLDPAATVVLDSNLDSEQTTALLAAAQAEFAASLGRDPRLRERASEAAQRSLSALLLGLGFKEVRFSGASAPVRAPRGT